LKKILAALLMSLIIILTFTACDDSGDYDYDAEYGDPAEFAGTWYSNAVDGRAFIFYEDGRYELYSIDMGESPIKTESGYFKPRGYRINLSDNGDEANFAISGQINIWDNGTLSFGNVEFSRLSGEPNAAMLPELSVMTVPLESYLGEWENDSNFAKITITETEYEINDSGSFGSGNIIRGPDYLLIGMDDLKLTVTDDGGLRLEGTNGTFYPKGSEKVANAPYKAFIGNWYRETADYQFQFIDNGTFTIAYAGYNDDGSIYAGFSGGWYEVNGGVLTYTYDDIEHTATLSGETMIISGIDGVFKKIVYNDISD